MPIVAPNRFPSLQSIMNYFRSLINDDGSGTDGPTGGLIATNNSPFSLVFLNSAISDLYADMRNIGDPALIVDNYLLLGLPATNGPNSAVQVALTSFNYFDGFTTYPQWTLPAGIMGIMAAWERPAGSANNFQPMTEAPAGLPPVQQGDYNMIYEWRGNAMWMPGGLISLDMRLRCKVTLPDFQGTTLDFNTTYVPLFNCTNAIVDKMLVDYATRFAPDQYPTAKDRAAGSLNRFQMEIVRSNQRKENARQDFGTDAVTSFNWNGQL
jgi:hypothetical protein